MFWTVLIAIEVALLLRARPIIRWLNRAIATMLKGPADADGPEPVDPAPVGRGRAVVRLPQYIGDSQPPTVPIRTWLAAQPRSALSSVSLPKPTTSEPPLLFDEFRAEVAEADPEFRTGTTMMFRPKPPD